MLTIMVSSRYNDLLIWQRHQVNFHAIFIQNCILSHQTPLEKLRTNEERELVCFVNVTFFLKKYYCRI